MKKRILSLLLAVMVISTTAVPASALPSPAGSPGTPGAVTAISSESSEPSDADGFAVSISDGVMKHSSSAPTEVKKEEEKDSTTVSAIGLYPFEIRYDTHNGAPVIIKSFKVPAGNDPAALIEEDFAEDGYIYSKKDILMTEPDVTTESKTVAELVSFTTEDDKPDTILASLNPVIEYNEGGYYGQLVLDYSSISSVVADKKSYSYPIKKTVEIKNLANNDYAYLDKELNGLTLAGADWKLQGGEQRGETMIPGNYTAFATYVGTGYGTKVTGYSNSAYYTGTVTRTVEGPTVYSIIYKGVPDPSVSRFPWVGVFIAFGCLAVAGGAVWLVVYKVLPNFNIRKNGGGTPPVQVPH